jgi:flagellar M-ring protein FliF
VAEQQTVTQQTRQVAGFLKSLTMKQRIWLLAGAIVIAALLFVFVNVLSKPEMKPLYTGLQPQDAQTMGTKLAAQKIEYQISPDGTTVSVAANKLDAARLQVAADGGPKSGRMGFELFDKPNWGGSDFSEKVNYQRALEGELERTLQSLEGVEAVRVHLVLAQESLFTENQAEAKASVILKLRGSMLSPNTDVAIRRLVAGAVEKLRPENVTVIDAETDAAIGSPAGNAANAAETDRDQALAKELVRTMEPIIGEGGVRASVHVEYDETSGDETQESYDPAKSATLALQKSEETIGGALPQGVPGTASNIPNTASPVKATSSSDTQISRSESGTYGVNKTVRHTLLPAGRVKRITAAVLVNDAISTDASGKTTRAKRTPEELKQIETLARAALGILDSRGDVIAVENLSFREVRVETPTPPTKMEKVVRVGKQWSWLLRYGLIALLFLAVYWMVLRPVRKQIVQSFKQVQSHHQAETVLNGNTGHLVPLEENQDPVAQQTAQLKKQLVERAKAEPANASQLVQSWLREEEA